MYTTVFFFLFISYIRSSDDISSGYGSVDPIPGAALSRTASLTNASKTRLKAKKSEVSVFCF